MFHTSPSTKRDHVELRSIAQISGNLDVDNLAYLQDSDLPTLIFGCQVYAKDIAKHLAETTALNIAFLTDRPIECIEVNGKAFSVYHPHTVDSLFPKYCIIKAHHEAFARTDWSEFKNLARAVTIADLFGRYPTAQYVGDHIAEFSETMDIWSDRLSVDSYLAYLKARVSHDVTYIADTVRLPHYFQPDISPPMHTESAAYLDIGAFDGSDIDLYHRFMPADSSKNRIYCFEPDAVNCELIRARIARNNYPNVQIVQKAAADYCGTANFSLDEINSTFGEGVEIEVTTIDEFHKTIDIPVGLITADIEGAELSMLKGAANTIKNDKPVLAIKAYHKCDDLITLPQYIRSLVPQCKMYFRNHTPHSDDSVVYAVI